MSLKVALKLELDKNVLVSQKCFEMGTKRLRNSKQTTKKIATNETNLQCSY